MQHENLHDNHLKKLLNKDHVEQKGEGKNAKTQYKH